MFTLSIIPNFSGTKKELIITLCLCLVIDTITCLPLIF